MYRSGMIFLGWLVFLGVLAMIGIWLVVPAIVSSSEFVITPIVATVYVWAVVWAVMRTGSSFSDFANSEPEF